MYLTETREPVRDKARPFAVKVARAAATDLGPAEGCAVRILDEAAKPGLFGNGGRVGMLGPGFDSLTSAMVKKDPSRGHAGVTDQCGPGERISTVPVRQGSRSLRRLPADILATRTGGAQVFCDPETGTGVSGITITAMRGREGWMLNEGLGDIRSVEVERLYRAPRITQACRRARQVRRTMNARELMKKGAQA